MMRKVGLGHPLSFVIPGIGSWVRCQCYQRGWTVWWVAPQAAGWDPEHDHGYQGMRESHRTTAIMEVSPERLVLLVLLERVSTLPR